jgi:hypothetical protein
VAALAGVSNGPFAAIFPQAALAVPVMPVGGRPPPQQPTTTGIDGWLLDRLFGRR